MKKTELLRKLELIDLKGDYSYCSIEIVKSMIEEYETFQDLYDNYYHEAEREFIYYSQAFNYLMDNSIVDFSDAIENGYCETVSQIAMFYLTEEISEILAELEKE